MGLLVPGAAEDLQTAAVPNTDVPAKTTGAVQQRVAALLPDDDAAASAEGDVTAYKTLSTSEIQGVTIVRITQRTLKYPEEIKGFKEDLDALEERSFPDIVVDLSDVEFLSSALYARLIVWDNRVKGYGGTLKFAGMQPDVLEAIQNVGLHKLLALYDTVFKAQEVCRQAKEREEYVEQ